MEALGLFFFFFLFQNTSIKSSRQASPKLLLCHISTQTTCNCLNAMKTLAVDIRIYI